MILGQFPCFFGIFHIKPFDRPIFLNYPENLHPAGTYLVFNLQIRNEEADFSPLLGWLAQNRQEIDAVYAEELGLQLFPYLDNYYCEVRAHLKTEKSS